MSDTDGDEHRPAQTNDLRVSSVLAGSAENAVMAGAIGGGIHFHGTSRQERTPQQVPRPIGVFVNQERALGELADASAITASGGFKNSIVLITGTAGVGKTSLSIQWANENSALFPGGQLYLNMRGFDPAEPITPLDALTRLLPALDVPAAAIPDDLDAAAARLRSELTDRRMLLLLDNVSTIGQVRPLLPGNSRSMLLVTSRNSLRTLVSRDGARRIELELFSPGHAVELLRSLLSSSRSGDDEAGLTELASLCARLPLALRVAAERAIERRRDSLTELVHELRTESSLWESLSDDNDEEGDSIRAVFTWSYRALALTAAQMFRILGLHPGQEFSLGAAAALTGMQQAEARKALERLVGAHMVEEVAHDRYQLHDLLRAYAVDQVAGESESERIAAVNREVAWYARSAASAAGAVQTLFAAPTVDPVPPGCTPVIFDPDEAGSRDAAINWYEAERANLRSVSGMAAQYGLRRWTWQLALAVAPIHHATRGSFRDWLVMGEHGIDAARADEAKRALATLLTNRAVGFIEQTPRRLDGARPDLEEALPIWRELGDLAGQARALNALGWVELHSRHLAEAAKRFEEVHNLGERLPGTPWAAVGLENASLAYYGLGDLAKAADSMTRGIARFAELVEEDSDRADPRIEFDMRVWLARIRLGQGLLDQAGDAIARAREITAAQGDQAGFLKWTHLEEGHLELARGNPDAALVSLLDAMRACQANGDQALEAEAMAAIGDGHRALGDNGQAQDLYRAAALGFAAVREPWNQAAARASLARCLADDGRADAARAERQAALELLAGYDDTGVAELRRELADALEE